MAGSARPVPLSELKKPAVLPDINEFDIGKWLHSAIDLLNKADTSWQRVQQGLGPPQLAEDAYRNWRRVGEIMSQLRRHRDFDKLVQQKLPALYTYHAIRERLISADTFKSIQDYLEKREADYKLAAPSQTPAPTNGHQPVPSQAAAKTDPEPAPVSIQDRLAALRAKGLSTGTTNAAASRSAAPSSNGLPPASPPRPIVHRAPSAPTVEAPSALPSNDTPRLGSDQVEDAAENRSGSVPPSIEASLASLEIQDGPHDIAVPPRTEPTPIDFGAQFPSLEELEKRFPATPVPSVNGTSTRPPLPIPPKPEGLDRSAFERKERERALAREKIVQSTSKPKLPFTNEVLPKALWEYLQVMLSSTDTGSRALLIDVRPRSEFERARIIGESVCLEPVILRKGVTSADIESSLSVSPKRELQMFEARHKYDVVIIYDRASQTAPNSQPPSTAPEAQRILWNLTNAIYEKEFTKNLQRQPVLLKGGFEAWERDVGSKGIHGTSVAEIEAREREVRNDHRRTAIIGDQSGTAILKASTDEVTTVPPPVTHSHGPTRLAMPSPAVQRSGSSPAFEYPFPHSTHPPQPSLNGTHLRQEYSSQSYEPQPLSLDYPQLRPTVNGSTRPPAATIVPPPPMSSSSPYAPVPLTRPPAAQPAPLRGSHSASTYPTVQIPPRLGSTSSSRYSLENIRFGDEGIGLTGLKNFGNTCYMNSTLQCLSATIPFAKYFREGVYKRDVNLTNKMGTKGALADAVAELIRTMWNQQYTFLSPVTFREKITKWAPQFKGSDQHDAQEFLGFLLDGLHEDLNLVVHKPPPVEMSPEREYDLEHESPQLMSEREWAIYRRRDDSFIVQCFQGQFRNQLRCLTCTQTSTTYNTFMPLSIPIPNFRSNSRTKVTLLDCIAQFVREEILDKDEKWLCPRCKVPRKASKRLTLSRLPPILVIQLKRFSFQGPFSDKIETVVQYPLQSLDLSPFMPPSQTSQKPPSRGGWIYDLYGVVNHYGNLSSGHYTAYVRNNRTWNNIGDSKVTENIDPKFVESAPSAYILFYRIRQS